MRSAFVPAPPGTPLRSCALCQCAQVPGITQQGCWALPPCSLATATRSGRAPKAPPALQTFHRCGRCQWVYRNTQADAWPLSRRAAPPLAPASGGAACTTRGARGICCPVANPCPPCPSHAAVARLCACSDRRPPCAGAGGGAATARHRPRDWPAACPAAGARQPRCCGGAAPAAASAAAAAAAPASCASPGGYRRPARRLGKGPESLPAGRAGR